MQNLSPPHALVLLQFCFCLPGFCTSWLSVDAVTYKMDEKRKKSPIFVLAQGDL